MGRREVRWKGMRKQEERGIRRDGEVGGGIVDGWKKVGDMKLLGFLVRVPRFSRAGKYLTIFASDL
jgi:argonaute-like protein implicated in RNA metabolism and viral defense